MKKKTWIALVVTLFALVLVLTACGESTPTECVIQYEHDGLQTQTVAYGEMFQLETVPAKTGYTFAGLFDAETEGTMIVKPNGTSVDKIKAKETLILYPRWTPIEYTVTFYNGEVVMDSRSVVYGAKIANVPATPTKANSNFVGWYTQADCEGVQVGNASGLFDAKATCNENNYDLTSGEIKLYAGFELVKYAVRFYLSLDRYEDIDVEYGANVDDVVVETAVDNRLAIAWSTDSNHENVFHGRITSAMTLYAAEWAPYIRFDTNGGDYCPSLARRSGSNVTLPEATRKNYRFMGWTKDGEAYASRIMPEESITLLAVWQAMIVFEENGGETVEDVSEVQGAAITLPMPEKEGYIFAGWYVGNEKYESTTMPAESVVLTAKYYRTQKTEYVLLSASTQRSTAGYTSPTMEYAPSYFSINVTKIHANQKTPIKITAHYKSRNAYASESRQLGTHMRWFNAKSTSSAYLVWNYTDTHRNSSWETYTRQTQIELDSDYLYVCIYADRRGSYEIDAYWTDFWVEIEYPDTSAMY